MQWNQTSCVYMQRKLCQVQNQEQTQQVRLPDGMPDVRKVLGGWGQVILRSKEWRSDCMLLTGGVNAWVLYVPEDGSAPKAVECWLPFQAKWNLPECKREGVIRANCLLRGLDARILSARKLMVRATLGLQAEALEPSETEIFTPEEATGDVKLLEKTYPVTLPREAGEKLFLLDEEINLPEENAELIAWDLEPILTEETVIGGRAVFKGSGRLHLVYMGGDGHIHSGHYDLPFAQYTDLDRDYDKEATVSAVLAVSNLEPELGDGTARIKCGILAQYMVYDHMLLTLAEDAYSPWRAVEPQIQMLELPVVLDSLKQTVDAQVQLRQEPLQVVDTVFYPEHPVQYREGETVVAELPGSFQIIGYDAEGELQAVTENWMEKVELPAAPGCNLHMTVQQSKQPAISGPTGQQQAMGQLQLAIVAGSQQQIPMVTGLEMGPEKQLDPSRPSLILQRVENQSLWELAKGCGSTVEAIRGANQLTSEPVPGQMLLIPVC